MQSKAYSRVWESISSEDKGQIMGEVGSAMQCIERM